MAIRVEYLVYEKRKKTKCFESDDVVILRL